MTIYIYTENNKLVKKEYTINLKEKMDPINKSKQG